MARVQIVSNGLPATTKVYVDGNDITTSVKGVTWHVDATMRNQLAKVTLELIGTVELDVIGETDEERKAREQRNDEINRIVRKEWDAEFNGIPIDSPDNPTDH